MSTTEELVQLAVAALAAAMPGPAVLTVGQPVAAEQFSSPPSFLLPEDPELALVTRLAESASSGPHGDVAIVIGVDLVEALAPDGIDDLDDAVLQAALDAAAVAVGGLAQAGERLDVQVALDSLLGRPHAYLVPLSDPTGLVTAAAIVALTRAAEAEPAQSATPETAAAEAAAPETAIPAAATTEPAPTEPAPAPAAPTPTTATPFAHHTDGLDLLRDVGMEVTVELGRTRMTVRELLQLAPGTVVELDRSASNPADLLVSGTVIAGGEVVVIDENFGLRITQVVAGADVGADGSSR